MFHLLALQLRRHLESALIVQVSLDLSIVILRRSAAAMAKSLVTSSACARTSTSRTLIAMYLASLEA